MSTFLLALEGTGFAWLMTTLGAAVVFFFRKEMKDAVHKSFLGFAAGVMIAAGVWSLLIPAIEQAEESGQRGFVPAAGGFLLGAAFLLAMDKLIPHLHLGEKEAEGPQTSLHRTTLMVFAVTLHNIPEGMAVAVPLISGGMGRGRAAAAAALTGAPTVLGALLGFSLGTLGPSSLTLALSFASGAMLYVVFGELLPEASLLWHGKIPALAAVLGIITGMVIVYA